MSESSLSGVRERLKAYILPRAVRTDAETAAFERAAEVQAAFEESGGAAEVPGGVKSFAVGGFSATMSDATRCPAYTRETISPVAWSILRNAGLIAYDLPTARKA